MIPISQIQGMRRKVDERLAALSLARKRCQEERQAIKALRREREDLTTALTIARAIAEQVQRQAHARIADIVTRSLEVVFESDLKFEILFEQKRGKTEARLVFKKDDLELDPMDASGGGVVDVAAFALRLSCLLLSTPPLRKLLVLDEPFKHLSREFRPKVKTLLESLSKELGVQILMVTHASELAMGTVVEIGG